MSGICGLFNLNDAPVVQAELRAMTAMLERRGPERTGQWLGGALGLGHTLLATTPELRHECMPFTHAQTGCSITADVRLDNRNELLGALDLQERSRSMGDAELILNAYLAWGEQCLHHLLGDFAFAIWDPRSRALFCARDHFGLRPLYYHHASRQQFVFASEARAILVLPQVPYRLNAGRIADFLVPQLEWLDYTSTFFHGIHRLPPGHKLSVRPAGLTVLEYWKPQPGPELGRMSDEDYRQGFLEVFTEAVKARLRTPAGSVASMLSGGMDSGSVVVVAKQILDSRGKGPLPTFSATRSRNDDTDCAESRAIHAALSMPSLAPTLLRPEALQGISGHLLAGNDEPFDGEFLMLKAIYRAAHQQGRRVVLDGGAGDTVLSEGSYTARLIQGGHFQLAMAEIAAEKKFWGSGSTTKSFFQHTQAALVPEVVKGWLRPLRDRRHVRGWLQASLISREFAASVDVEGRLQQMRATFATGSAPGYAAECCHAIRPNVTAGRERYARIAAAAGVEARDPFLDKRLVDFCSRLPGRHRLQGGWPKMILRKLMADKLPNEVLWCRGKPHLGWLFNEAVSKNALHQGQLDKSELGKMLADYVDPAVLGKAWGAFLSTGDAEQIHSAHILAVWLREKAQRPVVPV